MPLNDLAENNDALDETVIQEKLPELYMDQRVQSDNHDPLKKPQVNNEENLSEISFDLHNELVKVGLADDEKQLAQRNQDNYLITAIEAPKLTENDEGSQPRCDSRVSSENGDQHQATNETVVFLGLATVDSIPSKKTVTESLNAVASDHPNVKKNLCPSEIAALFELLSRAQPSSASDIKKIDDLQNKILHGKPLDSNHPRASTNLSITQKRQLSEIEQKLQLEKLLTPEEDKTLDSLKELIVQG